jgi:methionyl-tRNA formyltransferase
MHRKIGLLSTIDSPLLPYYLKSLLDSGQENIYIIADRKGFGAANGVRFQERTNGCFNSSNLTLDSFAGFKIPTFSVDNHNDLSCISIICSLELDLLLNVGTPRKLSKDFLESVGSDILNVHPGVLPYYRGSSCVEWAILNDGPIGNTAHFMVEDYDAGPIIAVEQYQFRIGSSYTDIRSKVYRESIRLMMDAIELIFESGLHSNSSEAQESGIEAYRPITFEDMLIVQKKIMVSAHHAICL